MRAGFTDCFEWRTIPTVFLNMKRHIEADFVTDSLQVRPHTSGRIRAWQSEKVLVFFDMGDLTNEERF
jgi:hypothetical protein